MKLSEFIEELEDLKKEHGDKEIKIYVTDDPYGTFYEEEPTVKYEIRNDSFVIPTV